MVKYKILLGLFLLLSIDLFAQSDQKFDKETITKFLYQHANDDVPGMAVGIVKDGKIVYEHYLGYANLEHKVKIYEDTRFNIASDAKQFTAMCILKLIEQGELNLEDDFRKYLPDLYKNIQDKITISNLISHTSGIRDYAYLIGLTGKTTWKQFIDNDDVIALLQDQKDLNFKPGTEYLYSNSNYILLAEIVTSVTGQKFSAFAKGMFDELGMANTSFLTNYMAIIPHKASPYSNWNGWREEPSIGNVHGDGALFTTLQDQLIWEQIIQLNDGKFFSKNFIDKSQSSLVSSIDNSYGYGLEFGSYGNLKYSYHNGSTGAYNATFFRFPREKVSIVIMTNNRNVPTNYLAQQLADYTLRLPTNSSPYPSYPDKTEPLESIEDLLGVYQSKEDGTIIKIVEKDGSLYRELYQRDPVKLVKKEGALFEYETKDMRINFSKIAQTMQRFVLYNPSLKPQSYMKISELAANELYGNDLTGNFYNGETDTKIEIKFLEKNSYSVIKNGKARKAELIWQDHLRMNSYIIKLIRDEENNITGLNVRNYRIKNVIFSRI